MRDEFGNALRQDGEILFPGDAKPVAYQTSAEMMNLLANSDRVKECLTRKVSQFLLGRPLDMNDAASLQDPCRFAEIRWYLPESGHGDRSQ